MHRLVVEFLRHPPGLTSLDRQRCRATDDAIEIMPLHRRKPRIEIIRDLLHIDDRDTLVRHHQMGIERIAQLERLPLAGQIGVDDLAPRMNT
ncbi:hypothetical protein D3C80_1910830 [compost metagenome]